MCTCEDQYEYIYIYIRFYGLHPCSVHRKVIFCHLHTLPFKNGMKSISKNSTPAFKYSDGNPRSGRADPSSPCHLFRAFARLHPQLQLPLLLLRIVILGVYAVFQ